MRMRLQKKRNERQQTQSQRPRSRPTSTTASPRYIVHISCFILATASLSMYRTSNGQPHAPCSRSRSRPRPRACACAPPPPPSSSSTPRTQILPSIPAGAPDRDFCVPAPRSWPKRCICHPISRLHLHPSRLSPPSNPPLVATPPARRTPPSRQRGENEPPRPPPLRARSRLRVRLPFRWWFLQHLDPR